MLPYLTSTFLPGPGEPVKVVRLPGSPSVKGSKFDMPSGAATMDESTNLVRGREVMKGCEIWACWARVKSFTDKVASSFSWQVQGRSTVLIVAGASNQGRYETRSHIED